MLKRELTVLNLREGDRPPIRPEELYRWRMAPHVLLSYTDPMMAEGVPGPSSIEQAGRGPHSGGKLLNNSDDLC